MSAIFAYFGENTNEKIINRFMSAIEKMDCYFTNQIMSSFCLLGKLDSQHGIEKSVIKEDDISIVSCGEVFNENVSNLEKEILLLYKEQRLGDVANLNGSFSCAIYDHTKEKLTIVNDRHGQINLFYYFDNNFFCLSPKIKPLLAYELNPSFRQDSVIEFFLFGYLLADKTFFEHIFQLPPASILEISKNEFKITKYWKFEYKEDNRKRSKDELINELNLLWKKAVNRRIKKCEKIIIPISGGLDSRAILAAALECTSKENIITFTFGVPGSFDFEIGTMVSKFVEVENIALGVEYEDLEKQYILSFDDIEGMIDITPYFALNGYKNMQLFANNIYLGYMGDPIMGSHITASMSNEKINSNFDCLELANIIFYKHSLNSIEIVHRLLNQSSINVENYLSSFEMTVNDLIENNNQKIVDLCAIWDFNHRQNKYTPFAIFRFRKHFHFINPFLDNDLIDFMLTIPPSLRLNTNLYKLMLLKNYEEFFSLPTKNYHGLGLDANRYSILFKSLQFICERKINSILKVNRFPNKNNNYIDYDDLLRTNHEYRHFMQTMIEKVKLRKYFNEDYVDELWNAHMAKKEDYCKLFGLLVTFELLLEEFIDEQNI